MRQVCFWLSQQFLRPKHMIPWIFMDFKDFFQHLSPFCNLPTSSNIFQHLPTSSNIFQHSSRFFLFTCCASAMPGSSSEVADPESPEVDDHLDGSSNKAQQGTA